MKWENRLLNWDGKSCRVTVDGMDFKIWDPTPFSSKWWSHKFDGPVVKYKVTVSIFGGDIVWVNGLIKGGESDITIFWNDLKNTLSQGEKVEIDKGYADT